MFEIMELIRDYGWKLPGGYECANTITTNLRMYEFFESGFVKFVHL